MTGATDPHRSCEEREDQSQPSAPELDRALLDVTRALTAISLRAADEVGGVSVVQLRALTLLAELGPASLTDLALRMGVTPSTTSRLVDRLVAAGLVTRRMSADSRRKVELRLTDEGRATLDNYDGLRLEELRRRLATLPEQRRRHISVDLPACSTALRAPERDPDPARGDPP